MTLKVFHSRRISYTVIYEKMGISASWSVSWRCQYYQQASSLLVGCSIGLVLLQQMLYHQESWYSSQVDVVCLCPFVWYSALWPVVSAVLTDIMERARGGLCTTHTRTCTETQNAEVDDLLKDKQMEWWALESGSRQTKWHTLERHIRIQTDMKRKKLC